jgi:hypothetical protein
LDAHVDVVYEKLKALCPQTLNLGLIDTTEKAFEAGKGISQK